MCHFSMFLKIKQKNIFLSSNAKNKKSIISILMIIVHSFLGSKYLHVHTFENFFSAHTRITKLIYYLYSEYVLTSVGKTFIKINNALKNCGFI
jgi:hypothetical protein